MKSHDRRNVLKNGEKKFDDVLRKNTQPECERKSSYDNLRNALLFYEIVEVGNPMAEIKNSYTVEKNLRNY